MLLLSLIFMTFVHFGWHVFKNAVYNLKGSEVLYDKHVYIHVDYDFLWCKNV